MENRTILAFVLSFVVLLAWAFLFNPKQDPGPEKPGSDSQKQEMVPPKTAPAKTPEAASTNQPPADPRPALPASTSTRKEVHVETPLYHAVLTNDGARIKGFKLKKYRATLETHSPFVELMERAGSGENFMAVTFGALSATPREGVFYHADREKIDLTEGSAPQELTFSGRTPEGLSVTYTYRFHPDRYPIELSLVVQNDSPNSVEGNFKAQIRNILPEDKQSSYSFTGLAILRNKKLQEFEPGDLKEDKSLSGKVGWMTFENEYFMTAFIPHNGEEASFLGRKLSSGHLEGSLMTVPPVSLPPQERASAGYSLYLGPRDLGLVKEMGKDLEVAIDFGWTDIIAKPLLYSLHFFNRYLKNYGLAIILLTVLIKILFWPLTHKSYKSMKEMQKIQPLMAKIRERYKDNREQMNREMMALYKTYKVNPMGGCLPMVIQIPVFFALFRLLGSAIELRHAPFVFWINDLSAPDRLFSFPFEIPYMTPPHGIPVLTLLMGASMFIQQKMTPTPGDQTQAKIMMLLPIIFTVMFINFPSGLVLYWLINNLLSIGQQYRILKKPA